MRAPLAATAALLVSVCCLVPALPAVVLDLSARAARPLLRSGEFAEPADTRTGCAAQQDSGGDLDGGLWAASNQPAVGSVYLAGHSNASQLSDGLLRASGELNLNATILTRSACPFAALEVSHDRRSSTGCRAFLKEVQERLRSSTPEIVVVATAVDVYINDSRSYRWRSDSGASIDSAADRAAAWAPAMISLLKPIAQSGSKIVIVLPPPKFEGWLEIGGAHV